MKLLQALWRLAKSGATLLLNLGRLISMKIALPLLVLAKRVGVAAKAAEQAAAEVEKRIAEEDSPH
jgi:hypothetical protein